jgi:hypothetical protein
MRAHGRMTTSAMIASSAKAAGCSPTSPYARSVLGSARADPRRHRRRGAMGSATCSTPRRIARSRRWGM